VDRAVRCRKKEGETLTFAEDEPERIGSRQGEGEEMERAEAGTGIDAAGQVAGGHVLQWY
jgi:hypothetical protein